MSLDDDIHSVSLIPIFAVLEPEARRLLVFSSEAVELRSGEVLFCKGEQSDGGYVLLGGSISFDKGHEASPLIVKPVAMIGEIAIISQTERVATVMARDEARLLKIARNLFLRVLQEYPQSAGRVKELISRKLSVISDQLEMAQRVHFP